MNSFSVNKLFIVGRLGSDAKWISFNQGDERGYISFAVATEVSWKSKTTNERSTKTTWHQCKLILNSPKENLLGVLKKGALVAVEGRVDIQPREQGGVFASVEVSDFTLLAKAENKNKQPDSVEVQTETN